jgi:hypothetical protein
VVRGGRQDPRDLPSAISLGLSRNFADDHEMLGHGMVMYDALYAWCREGKDELHTWNPRTHAPRPI